LHPVRMACAIGPACRVAGCTAVRGLACRAGRGVLIEVDADQAEVQVPALGAAVGVLDPRRDDVRVTR
jgi:hypothetical protein